MSAPTGQMVRVSPTVYLSTLTTPVLTFTKDSWNRKYCDRDTEQYFSRQARHRGMAALHLTSYPDRSYSREDALSEQPWARIKLAEVRAALDAVTLDGAESAEFKLHGWPGMKHYAVTFDPGALGIAAGVYNGKNTMKVTLDGARIVLTAPCGERRRYTVKTLDRALLALGY